MSRKNLSPKTRFEVLKRDAYTCQYCGRKAPEVTLQIDHIIAVANGGEYDMDNLVTACTECNYGKRTAAVVTDDGMRNIKIGRQRPCELLNEAVLKMSCLTLDDMAKMRWVLDRFLLSWLWGEEYHQGYDIVLAVGDIFQKAHFPRRAMPEKWREEIEKEKEKILLSGFFSSLETN